MNDLQLRLLATLKEACDSPVVKGVADEGLRAHMADIKVLASHLLVEMTTAADIKKATMREYASLARDIEEALTARHVSAQKAQELKQIAADEDADRFEACLALAREVQLVLRDLGGAEADALQLRLAQLEGAHGNRVLDALAQHVASDSTENPAAGAGQTKTFDREKLAAFIARSFPEETGVQIAECKFISGGSSKYTMGISLTGVTSLPKEIILRGDSTSSAGYGGASAIDEFRLFKVLDEHGICIPTPLAAEPSGDVFGSPFMLVERRPGAMLGHFFNLPKPNKALGLDLAKQLAGIHRISPAAIGDWIKGAKVSTSEQVAATIEESFASWEALQRPSPLFETAFKWLRDNVAVMDRSRGLVHGDYSLHNILVEGSRVSAILDWEFAHIGNPAYDLGYFYDQAASLTTWQEFLDAYQAAGGSLPSAEELDYSMLFATTRLGVMTCQAEAAYRAGIAGGLFMALTFGRYCHNITLKRMDKILRRVL